VNESFVPKQESHDAKNILYHVYFGHK